MNYGQRFVHCTGDRDQDHPHAKEMHKSKMAVLGGLTNSCEKKRSEKQRRKGKIFPFGEDILELWNAEFQRIARRDKKAFFSDQCKEIEENNRMGKTLMLGMIEGRKRRGQHLFGVLVL